MLKRLLPRLVLGAIVVGLPAAAPPVSAPRALEPIVYTITFREPQTQHAEVEATVPTGGRESIELMMAVWSPGFYRTENYASRVEGLSARTVAGKALRVEQPHKNRWKVHTSGAAEVVLSYRLLCKGRSVTTNWVGDDHAVLNGAATFITLVEQARRPHVVRLELPAKWKRSMTALDAEPGGRPNHYRAVDFDTLVDSPIVAGNPMVSTFTVQGSKHHLVSFGDVGDWDAQRATGDIEKIVREHHRMWGFLPSPRYVFLLAFRPGGGGLEHSNSTLVTTNPKGIRTTRGYQAWLGLVCHEYFHAYNVKRLRPIEFSPFDYEKEVRTSSLWVSEGLTTYYGNLLLTRAGLMTPQAFLALLASQITKLQTSPGRLLQTLEQSSSTVWTSSFSGLRGGPRTVSYYVKGAVVGFLLDARVRRATSGSKSLDDVMRLACKRYSGERGFTPEQFRKTAEEVAGEDLAEWFRKVISSTEELDYTEALDWFGLRFAGSDGPAPGKKWVLEARSEATASQRARVRGWLGAALPDSTSQGQGNATQGLPAVTAPPASLFDKVRERDREVARKFYKKYVDVKGVAVLASAEVADEALQRTWFLVTRMLAGRPDILNVMAKNGTRLIIIGKDQVYTDMPEYRNSWNREYMNERVRGTGGLGVTSFGEENLLNLPLDRYDDESIAVHEFCHTIDAALRRLDPDWRKRLAQTYKSAIGKGLWKNAYAASNPAEYWAEICQSYFDCNRVNNWNHNAVGTREQLRQYDPGGYDLVKTTFKLTAENDWRYKPLRQQPSVIAPPARFKIDPYYTKFTYAREFPVLGSKHTSDQALLKANDTIRKMFAYRHDLLKAMIAAGARLVVLGRQEKLSDLPEFKESHKQVGFDEVRYLDYTSGLKLMVVPEENVLGLPSEPFAGKSVVVSVFARGLYQVTAQRPVDPGFEKRRDRQQYELRVKRLDVEFDRKLQKLHEDALKKERWKGTAAARHRVDYWAAGVEAYFDAAGAGHAPNDADRPITTREVLRTYDPDLYALVDETMAYRGHVDWRFRR
jgi:predicted metalloprotease with PDZ domain